MEEQFKPIYEGVINGNAPSVKQDVQTAIDGGTDADDILKKGLIPAMQEVGDLFEKGEYFVPEMLVAARAMQGGLELLKPLLASAEVQSTGKVVLGTVQGDLHDIGKNLVGMMLEGAGFETIDLGTDVGPEAFIEAVREHQPQLMGMSALLTTTMVQMKATIEALEEAGLKESVKIMIGGAPVTDAFAREIGADAYAADAASAVDIARGLVA